MAPDSPASEASPIPNSMYPMWLTRVKDNRRLMSDCATAPRMPTIMVSSAATRRRSAAGPSGNSSVWVRMMA
jgi:hypothetical protein